MPNDPLSKYNIIIESDDPELVDPSTELINKLKQVWKPFAVGFYEADSFAKQSEIVKNFHNVLQLIVNKEDQDAVVKSKDLRQDKTKVEEEVELSPPKLKDFKIKVAAFQKDIALARQLVKKSKELTKRNLLTGDEVRGQIKKFIKKLQKDLNALNQYLLTFKPKETLQEAESLEKYKKKVQVIEKAHDKIVKKLGPAIEKIIKRQKVVWPEMRELATQTLETLKQITKYFPTMVPFEKGQVENEKLMDAFTDALLNFKVGTVELKALKDVTDGKPNLKLWPSLVKFQKRMIAFSRELERIFGIPGITGEETLSPEPPAPSDTEAGDVVEPELREKYKDDPFFKGLNPEQQTAVLKFIKILMDDAVITEASKPAPKELDDALSKLDEESRAIVADLLSNSSILKQFTDMIGFESADSDKAEPSDQIEKYKEYFQNQDNIKFYQKAKAIVDLLSKKDMTKYDYSSEEMQSLLSENPNRSIDKLLDFQRKTQIVFDKIKTYKKLDPSEINSHIGSISTYVRYFEDAWGAAMTGQDLPKPSPSKGTPEEKTQLDLSVNTKDTFFERMFKDLKTELSKLGDINPDDAANLKSLIVYSIIFLNNQKDETQTMPMRTEAEEKQTAAYVAPLKVLLGTDDNTLITKFFTALDTSSKNDNFKTQNNWIKSWITSDNKAKVTNLFKVIKEYLEGFEINLSLNYAQARFDPGEKTQPIEKPQAKFKYQMSDDIKNRITDGLKRDKPDDNPEEYIVALINVMGELKKHAEAAKLQESTLSNLYRNHTGKPTANISDIKKFFDERQIDSNIMTKAKVALRYLDEEQASEVLRAIEVEFVGKPNDKIQGTQNPNEKGSEKSTEKTEEPKLEDFTNRGSSTWIGTSENPEIWKSFYKFLKANPNKFALDGKTIQAVGELETDKRAASFNLKFGEDDIVKYTNEKAKDRDALGNIKPAESADTERDDSAPPESDAEPPKANEYNLPDDVIEDIRKRSKEQGFDEEMTNYVLEMAEDMDAELRGETSQTTSESIVDASNPKMDKRLAAKKRQRMAKNKKKKQYPQWHQNIYQVALRDKKTKIKGATNREIAKKILNDPEHEEVLEVIGNKTPEMFVQIFKMLASSNSKKLKTQQERLERALKPLIEKLMRG